jgi:hypothetical protein
MEPHRLLMSFPVMRKMRRAIHGRSGRDYAGTVLNQFDFERECVGLAPATVNATYGAL